MIPTIRTIRLSHRSGAELNAVVTTEPLMIGRSPRTADLICSWDKKMSRCHAKVWLENDLVWFEDLGSSNGSWLDKARLSQRVVVSQKPILLGETLLSLTRDADEAATLEDGMTLQLRQPVSRQDFAGALQGAAEMPDVLKTLAIFVDKLLGTAMLTEIAPCLRSLYAHLPTAQNIYLIGPPTDGEITHLIPPKSLTREGTKVGSVSRSLAEMAISRGEALLFSQTEVSTARIYESTRLKGIHSAVYVPLIGSDNSVLGVLCVDSPHSALPLHQENFQLLKSAGALLSARLDGEQLRQTAKEKEIESRELEARREILADFLKIASHDLKNPLTVVKMCGVIIDRLTDDEKISDLCARILDAERRAEQLIASYLEVSELESTQTLTIDTQMVNVKDIVDREFAFLTKAHERKDRKVTLENQVPDRQIKADPHKLEQVLSNLISNGIKYGSQHPHITVGYLTDGDTVILSVTDDGYGISAENQEKLFAQFQRVEKTRQIPGTGLGLWLSNVLVQAHGGTMWVESVEGEGSTFSFSLPQN
jgi:signal transduction histidine kinase/pSer/pThr/pTyr-binding forkhead associated (FHA) protein